MVDPQLHHHAPRRQHPGDGVSAPGRPHHGERAPLGERRAARRVGRSRLLATDAAGLAGLLADATRRRVFAALVLGDQTVEQVRESTGLTTREIVRAVARLVDGELVVAGADGMYFVVEEAFTAAAREAAPVPDAAALRPSSSTLTFDPSGMFDALDGRSSGAVSGRGR